MDKKTFIILFNLPPLNPCKTTHVFSFLIYTTLASSGESLFHGIYNRTDGVNGLQSSSVVCLSVSLFIIIIYFRVGSKTSHGKRHHHCRRCCRLTLHIINRGAFMIVTRYFISAVVI